MPRGPDIRQHRRQPFREPIRIRTDSRPERRSALSCASQCRRAVGVAQLHPARLGHCQRLLGAARDRLALGLGDEGHNAHGQIVRLRHVEGQEMHTAVALGQQKRGVASQPVELGDHQRGTRQSRQLDRGHKLRPIEGLVALDFGEARQHLGAFRCRKAVDGVALGFQPEVQPIPKSNSSTAVNRIW